MPALTRQDFLDRIADLEKQFREKECDLQAIGGALQDAKWLLQRFDAPGKPETPPSTS